MTTENRIPAGTPFVPVKKVYSVAEVAVMLQVHPNTVYKLVRQKAFISRKIGADIRISKASFDTWLNSQ